MLHGSDWSILTRDKTKEFLIRVMRAEDGGRFLIYLQRQPISGCRHGARQVGSVNRGKRSLIKRGQARRMNVLKCTIQRLIQNGIVNVINNKSSYENKNSDNHFSY